MQNISIDQTAEAGNLHHLPGNPAAATDDALSLDAIAALLATRGAALYGGEAVTQCEHALQCAALAEADGAAPSLIVAALLHDIGHLGQTASDESVPHGECGAQLLARLFGRAVTEPVRLHVQAKRYLCATDSLYYLQLSAASKASLAWQGGIFTPEQAKKFITRPHADDAVRLRRWDDAAKIPGMHTPNLEHFMAIARQLHALSAPAASPAAAHLAARSFAATPFIEA